MGTASEFFREIISWVVISADFAKIMITFNFLTSKNPFFNVSG
jgi:hypothetical protein